MLLVAIMMDHKTIFRANATSEKSTLLKDTDTVADNKHLERFLPWKFIDCTYGGGKEL